MSCQYSFESAKRALLSDNVLGHSSELPVKLAANASSYGVGAVISDQYADGSECPIAFASRSLSSSVKNYSQLEKKRLYHLFVELRNPVVLVWAKVNRTDRSLSIGLHSWVKECITALAAARLQQWLVLLSSYQYDIDTRSLRHSKVDCLS